MADIFLSYASADRPRAETLRGWFGDVGWTVWIDREIDLAADWADTIGHELAQARVVVVLWGPDARRSEWVLREAQAALDSGRLVQAHATGLPLPVPFDSLQAVRMQSWSGEAGLADRLKLLRAVAARLGTELPDHVEAAADEPVTAYHPEVAEALGLAFHYCARQLERVRRQRERGYGRVSDFAEIKASFAAMLALLRDNPGLDDDREGVLHRLMEDFLNELLQLVPDPGALT